MGISIFPAASASSKTSKKETLTSGTSWTVPTGVNYVVATLIGGGGGGAFASGNNSANAPGAGGTTTFTGATSASGGNGGTANTNGFTNGNVTTYGGNNGQANSGQPGGFTFTSISIGNTYTSPVHLRGGVTGASLGGAGWGGANAGLVVTSTVNTTPGATINYSIGSGGSAGNGIASDNGNTFSGNTGGSGAIILEYWV